MPSPSWIKNSGWSRFLAAWKIRVFYRRLLPRRTINSINISQVCEALCGFMRCFCFSKRQLTQDFHRLRSTSTVEFKFRPDSAVPTTTTTHNMTSLSTLQKIIFSTHVGYMFPPIQSVQHRLHFGDFAIRLMHCPATGKFRTDGSISGLMVRAV